MYPGGSIEPDNSSQKAGGTQQGLRILLIDDNEDSNEALLTLLGLFNYEVQAAADGKSALQKFLSFAPQLVLCDIGLPDISGYQLAPQLRELAAGREVVIASLSGWGDADDAGRGQAAGFDYQLTKPVDVDSLLKFAEEQASKLA